MQAFPSLHLRLRLPSISAAAALFAAMAAPAIAQQPQPIGKAPVRASGTLVIPLSSRVNPEDRGIRAHTNLRFIVPATANPSEAPPYQGYGYETPASLACIYRLVTPIRKCNPNSTVSTPTGGSQSIAIVDAYHDPDAASDLASFSSQFGIPFNAKRFKVVYQGASEPPVDSTGGWELEEALDIEYAHAMAPNAFIYLVEANSNSFSDLFKAVNIATNLVRCAMRTTCPANSTGKGEVSMSWGGEEFYGENNQDAVFNASNVVFLAATGDAPGLIYPAASPNVVAVGGTTTARSWVNGDLIEELAWSDAGGGLSYYEPTPSYQSGIAAIAQGARATPDISADANPATGVWVYNSFPYDGVTEPSPWWTVGGTSVATPTVAGILNAAATASGKFAANTTQELTWMYSQYSNSTNYNANFWDTTYGACNYYSGSFSTTGYDLCTGLGSPKGLLGK